ncbi:hypothetical protein [Gluconobacter japonicus]|uniref:Uncharacterized protein n=1 Tax=Gluconobacter japonicus TaxID=376620 RepID=A0ABQ5WJ04_GLUJA|nr:hypothetical protein [Gluconobacter japonicus]KXV27826.1 hypothetical protein AD937_03725 [Gluconobacter japonicus]KXV29448.1 hypothetical protein AD938_01970 [Gluconobacter japonicus]GBR28571.1 hypothetical protein AA3271_2783 [Gluconobacter japonicus NBRC 3271]GLQ60054.1 hypothetical protein GCM10010937_18570 [Gluconobacter japonicus]
MAATGIGISGAIGALENVSGAMSLRVWMEANREELLRAWNGRRLNWQALCAWFKDVGLTNADGQAPTVRCAKMTWYRAGKTLAARKDRAVAEADGPSRDQAARRTVAPTDKARSGPSDEEIFALMAEADNEERRNRERRERIAGYEAQRRTMAESNGGGVQSEAPVEATQSEPAPLETATRPRVKIGQIANHVTMLKQAPRYGADRDKPLPPPYVGPRPDGMPEYLPLDALMPLDATGRQPDGRIDYEALPGLPRRSFFERDRDWAKACIPMVEAIPHEDRSLILRGLLMRARDLMKTLY